MALCLIRALAKVCLMLVISFTAGLPLLAQQQPDTLLREVPLEYTIKAKAAKALQSRLNALGDTLSLPFWDDFSAPFNDSQIVPTYRPDTTLWTTGSQQVRLSEGIGIAPPTVGVATFDGLDEFGKPYSNNLTQSLLSDSLTSNPINLVAVPPAERNSVFISFFWQPMGNRDLPEAEDSLVLQFKTSQGNWVTQWVKAGNDSLPGDIFTQEIIQVQDTSYFHAGFQFRFQSYNRQYAAFDNWQLDYVYLNKNRSAADTTYEDRSLTSTPVSFFKTYAAIPMEAFRTAPASFVDSASVGYYRLNLNAEAQPIDYRAQVINEATGDTISDNSIDGGASIISRLRRTLKAKPVPVDSLDLTQDSLYLTMKFMLKSGDRDFIQAINGADTIFRTPSYRSNDTVASTFVLNDYFAYDDGEAESGLELNRKGAQLAYQYMTPTKLLLTHIDMYFPPLLQNSRVSSVKLMVWKQIGPDSTSTVVLRRASGTAIQLASYFNEMKSYKLSSPVFVQDTFYIGYEIETDSVPIIGFDKNINSVDKIFYKIGSGWEQNNKLYGSIMMRPKFSALDSAILTAIGDEVQIDSSPEKDFVVYPNPAENEVHIQGLHEEIIVFDLTGKERIRYRQPLPLKQATYQLGHLKKGLYLIRVRYQNQYRTFKLILQ